MVPARHKKERAVKRSVCFLKPMIFCLWRKRFGVRLSNKKIELKEQIAQETVTFIGDSILLAVADKV